MSAAKHTPGPWGVERHAPSVLTMGTQIVATEIAPDGASREERIANARLIAAAPELLEALRTTAGNIRSLGPARVLGEYREWLAVVDAAIAKAEGA